MKTLVQQVRETNTLARAWRVVLENGRSSRLIATRREIEEFARTSESRLTKIQRQLNRGAFAFPPSRGVAIPKKGTNKFRPLVIAPIESRIVQRAVHDVLLQVPAIRTLAENPYSFGCVRKKPGNDLGAVPAAIQATLEAIGSGAEYVIRSDISAFFTKIPKRDVTGLVANATNDPAFVDLFAKAVHVELENLASLRDRLSDFPIHEIGVAQGNSLSPLLGNLLLGDFDREMNAGVCRCLRYVDDFLILAPNAATANEQFARAVGLLAIHGMDTSAKKTFRGTVVDGFEFLGIKLQNGTITPTRESRRRLLTNVEEIAKEASCAFREHRKTGEIDSGLCLIRALSDVRGVVQGWGKHYSFCNEKNVFSQMDARIDSILRDLIGSYRYEAARADAKARRRLLGVPLLDDLVASSLVWPVRQILSKGSHA